MHPEQPASVPAALGAHIREAIAGAGGWLPFDRYMELALYTAGLGYYANDSRKFGALPSSGSDFVTAPELTPLFGRALAAQLRQVLEASGTAEVWEFGAGSGALAAQLLGELGKAVRSYHIVDLSGVLRERQRERLAAEAAEHLRKVTWHERLPDSMQGIVVGNEVLDAMPVQLLHFDGLRWLERGVAVAPQGEFRWEDRPTNLRPPVEGPFLPDTTIEIHPQAEAFVRTIAARLSLGAVFFIDYGFPEFEYYHAQRTGGTLMCHRGHLADPDPLVDVGLKDITSHVNFTGIAVAAQDEGMDVLGYTSQARFLMNCGILDLLEPSDLRTTAAVQKLLNEHEMGELFKVIGLARGFDASRLETLGFAEGDRTHRL